MKKSFFTKYRFLLILNLILNVNLHFIFKLKIAKEQTEKMGMLCDIDEDHDWEDEREIVQHEPVINEYVDDHGILFFTLLME